MCKKTKKIKSCLLFNYGFGTITATTFKIAENLPCISRPLNRFDMILIILRLLLNSLDSMFAIFVNIYHLC